MFQTQLEHKAASPIRYLSIAATYPRLEELSVARACLHLF